jgi:hypothetical protein
MSPRSRGRPPGRGRRQQPRRPGARPGGPHLAAVPAGDQSPGYEEETTDCRFDEPQPGDRRSWALPRAHGTYRGLDLGLDPGDEDDRAMLIEALHPEFADALQGEDDVIVGGETVNPRLHVAMHQVVANQLLADDVTRGRSAAGPVPARRGHARRACHDRDRSRGIAGRAARRPTQRRSPTTGARR